MRYILQVKRPSVRSHALLHYHRPRERNRRSPHPRSKDLCQVRRALTTHILTTAAAVPGVANANAASLDLESHPEEKEFGRGFILIELRQTDAGGATKEPFAAASSSSLI